ncbi:hypothetical protein [Nonomuraea sp. NPDC050783]|uniref:hypothetical protein n=1 Tax=Nonomuraea sp. NPDC050783 TaxID=3154634 RepID=UPI003465D0EA
MLALAALAGLGGAAYAATGSTNSGANSGGATAAVDDDDRLPSMVVGEGLERLPFRTARDWVGYADVIVVANVVSDREGTASDEEIAAGEGYIPRTAQLSVTETLWSTSGPWVPTPPTHLSLGVAGWAFHGEQRAEFVVGDAPRVEVGHTYIIPLARDADGGWAPLAPQAILPYDRKRIGTGEAKGIDPDDLTALSAAVRGKSGAELSQALDLTSPEAIVAKYHDLAPDARFNEVVQELDASAPPPSEDTADHGPDEPQDDPWNGAEDDVEEDPTEPMD